MMRLHGSARARRAAAATELAVLMPFLGLLFAVTVDFARVYYTTQTLDACACAGALYASGTMWTPTLTSDPISAAKNAACAQGVSLAPPLAAENVTVALTATTATVTVDYDFGLITPILNPSLNLHLTRSVIINIAPVAGN